MSSVLQLIRTNSRGNKSGKGIPGRKLNAPLKNPIFTDPLGIEIELEGQNLPNEGYLDALETKSGSRWTVKQDGSLRGGLEYTLNKPCRAEEVDDLIKGLFKVFKKRDTTLTPSNRCSLHVHYNIGGLKVNSITSIIALWTIFEEPLLRWWGHARYKNHFCLSSKDETTSIEAWHNFLTHGQLPEATNLRYTALNLVAIRKYGSLEFRGGGAVTSPDKGILWVRFLYNLCEYAKANYADPRQIAYDISERGAKDIFKDICGDLFAPFAEQVINTVDDFNLCCADSFYNFQPILFDFPWGEWLQKIDKAYVPNPFGSEPKAKLTEWAMPRAEWAMPRAERTLPREGFATRFVFRDDGQA